MKNILIIGGGSIGERHLRCFQKTGRVEVGLCEINDEVRNRVVETYGITQDFNSLDAVPVREFQAAVICVPAHLHIPIARRLAQSDLPLLIEKPLSTSLEGIEELIRESQQQQISTAVAYVLRHHPALVAVRDAVRSERFGKPVEVVMTSGQHFPLYRPAYREIYYSSHKTGGGAIQDALTHMVNTTEWIVGPVTRLVADAEHCVLEGVDVEDTVHLLTRHQQVIGSFSLNQHQFANETTLTIHCKQGSVRYEAHNSQWLTCTEPGQPWKIEETFNLERDDLFTAQAHHFLDVLDGTIDPRCSLEEGLQTLRVNLAALESIRTQNWIDL